jgi:REP element-mobilizing transposase RayT
LRLGVADLGLALGHSADRRFCGPRLFHSDYRHRAVFYRGVETPAFFPFPSVFLYRRVLAQAAREIHQPDFALLAQAFNRARALHPFRLTAWVFLPDHWHCICAPLNAVTISLAIKSVKQISTSAVNQCRGADGELWQPRFFDRALRTVKEYNEKVDYIHLNPVRAGLVSRPEDWRWSSYNEYAGMSANEQNERCGLIVDHVRMPAEARARI